MQDNIPIRPDRTILIGRQTSKWSLRDVVFDENNFTHSFTFQLNSFMQKSNVGSLSFNDWAVTGQLSRNIGQDLLLADSFLKILRYKNI